MQRRRSYRHHRNIVSVLFSEPKIPQFYPTRCAGRFSVVSVLFSEPKIPQCAAREPDQPALCVFQCSSASRKFLNFGSADPDLDEEKFQCSSASRKFLNAGESHPRAARPARFSALQRAENSSMEDPALLALFRSGFQCSSASRKFLNRRRPEAPSGNGWFQCSSASRKFLNGVCSTRRVCSHTFQCSSASRKFLNARLRSRYSCRSWFQCSSASRKFLNAKI